MTLISQTIFSPGREEAGAFGKGASEKSGPQLFLFKKRYDGGKVMMVLRRTGCIVLLTVIGFGPGLKRRIDLSQPELIGQSHQESIVIVTVIVMGRLLHENGSIYAPSPLYLHALAKADRYGAAALVRIRRRMSFSDPTNMSPLESG